MSIPLSGGEYIDHLAQLRQDAGLTRLLGRKAMAPSTAHYFRRQIPYEGLNALAHARRRMLPRMATRTGTTSATLDCDASLFTSTNMNARTSYKDDRGYMPMPAFLQQTLAQLPQTSNDGSDRLESLRYPFHQGQNEPILFAPLPPSPFIACPYRKLHPVCVAMPFYPNKWRMVDFESGFCESNECAADRGLPSRCPMHREDNTLVVPPHRRDFPGPASLPVFGTIPTT